MSNQYNTEVINVSTTGSDVLVFTATASTTLLKNIYWYSSSSANIQFKLKKNGGVVTEVSSFAAQANKQTPMYSSLIALEANDKVYLQSDAAGTLTIIYVQNSASLAGQSINILVDVDTNGRTTGDVLTYDGTDWVAQAFTGSSSLNLSVGSIDFDLSSPPSLADGRLAYDIDRETLIFQSEHGELAIGEGYKPATNNTGLAIPKGSVVKATGVSGEKFTIDLFDASAGVGEELYFIGVTQSQINDQADGIVVSEGFVKHLNTNSYPIGTILYASETAGELTSTRPTSPNLGIPVAMVTKRDLNNGTIYVRASTYNHLEEIHDVYIDTLGDNDILAYDATRGTWTNVSDIKVDSVETPIVKSTGDVVVKLDTDNNTANSSFKVQDGSGADVFVINESGIASYDANADAVFKTGKLTNISGDWNGVSLNGNLAYPGIQGIAGGDDIVSTMIIASEAIDIRPDLSAPISGGLRIDHDGVGEALVTINKGSTPPTTHNLYVGGNAKFDSTIDAAGAVFGSTGIVSIGNIGTIGNISASGSLTAATLNVPGAVSFGQITSSTGLLTPSITFTNTGQSTIGVGGLGPHDLVIQSNGNVTVELDADNDETSQKFAVNDPSSTERFSVSDTGVVTINSAFSLPSSDGTSGQTLQTNGTGTVSWITPTTPPSVIDDLSDVFISSPATGEFLKYDGSEWTNDNVTLNEVFDVNIASVTDGQVLTYDSTTSKWINETPSGGASDVVSDTTPQLGGNLDANGYNLDMTSNTASTLVITANQYAFRYKSTGGVLQTTGLYFNATTGQYEFLNGSAACIFCIKAGTGETSIGGTAGYTLPVTDGTANQILQTDGNGNADWVTFSGGSSLATANQTLTSDRLIDTNGYNFSIELDPTGTADKFTIHDGTNDLFQVDTNTTGTLFSVNDVSGLPLLEVESSGQIAIPTIATAAPTNTPVEGTMQFAIISGSYYLYAYLGGGWRSVQLT